MVLFFRHLKNDQILSYFLTKKKCLKFLLEWSLEISFYIQAEQKKLKKSAFKYKQSPTVGL